MADIIPSCLLGRGQMLEQGRGEPLTHKSSGKVCCWQNRWEEDHGLLFTVYVIQPSDEGPGIHVVRKCHLFNLNDPVRFSRQDLQKWFTVVCFCIATLDFVGGLLSKDALKPTLPNFQELIRSC